jgi:nucleotide-binding universal stress UspA family protein
LRGSVPSACVPDPGAVHPENVGGKTLKVLVAIDGSRYTDMAIGTLKTLQLPSSTEVELMTVMPEHTFLGGLTLQMLRRGAVSREQAHGSQEQRAAELLQGPADSLRESGVKVETALRRGSPAEQIIRQAADGQADLVVIGAKGTEASARFRLGSVAQKVMKYAGTSVLLVREKTTKFRRALLATDGSRHSDEAVRFLLALPLPHGCKVFALTSLESHIAALMKMPTLDLDTNRRMLLDLQEAEEKAARELLARGQKRFREQGYATEGLVLRGSPAEEILVAARTLNPDLVVVGAKGLTEIETFLLGSVAQRVARFSRYSVLIVRTGGR